MKRVPTAAGRRSIDQRFHGAPEATRPGGMLAHRGAAQGSAGYAGGVTGTLAGRGGLLVLQRRGPGRAAARRGLRLRDGLQGIAGRTGIEFVDGRHSYDFGFTHP